MCGGCWKGVGKVGPDVALPGVRSSNAIQVASDDWAGAWGMPEAGLPGWPAVASVRCWLRSAAFSACMNTLDWKTQIRLPDAIS